jgi:DNA-directed RNA polymerase II subunit RPB2
MGMLIPFPEHSPAPRNQYSCHQSKQALGLYVSNFRKRLDHANHILHYPERALTGSRYIKYINNERLNYGTNVIVAIMCYGGFNIEDSLLFNKGSVERGLFQSTYYYTEEVTEKDSQNEKIFVGRNIDIKRMHHKYNYSLVDKNTRKQGVIPPTMHNQFVKKNDVLIEAYEEKREPSGEGKSFTDYKRDASKDGYVDQVFLSDDVRGRRVAKVTLRNVRTPVIGDKFASRSGQKGTLGALVEEEDMPFIGDCGGEFLQGLKPDIILNPHAMPSRMTIGQMLESLSSAIGTRLGRVADSTPLSGDATRSPVESLMKLMHIIGLNAHGNQTLYNGNTGEKLTSEVFVGPTYYQRLKQMPIDKYYHRRTGRADMVTRQPIGGRAQGGALKLGEMERDSLIAHGISQFTKEAFNEKSDGFQYKVSTNTGMVHPPTVTDKVDYDHFTPVRRTMDFLTDDDAGGFKEYLPNDAMNVTDFKSHRDVVQKERLRTNEPECTVNVPFATRLLSQECEAMGVGMRMMTESSEPVEIRTVDV